MVSKEAVSGGSSEQAVEGARKPGDTQQAEDNAECGTSLSRCYVGHKTYHRHCRPKSASDPATAFTSSTALFAADFCLDTLGAP